MDAPIAYVVGTAKEKGRNPRQDQNAGGSTHRPRKRDHVITKGVVARRAKGKKTHFRSAPNPTG